MKRILTYLSAEKYPSLFDIIVAYDSGADVVVPYGNLEIEDVPPIVYSCAFTRSPKNLENTAIFVGGKDVNKAEELMHKADKTFKTLPNFFRVSIVADPSGAYTTASSIVAKVKGVLGDIKGLNATVLGGSGAVGQKTCVLLAKEGCNVTLTSLFLDWAEDAADIIKKRHKLKMGPLETKTDKQAGKSVSKADIVIATGPEGVQIMSRNEWKKHKGIKVMVDVNAVPPHGIEDISPQDDDKEIEGRRCFGALSIGNLKMKVHRELVKQLFKEKGVVFDLDRVYAITEEIYNEQKTL